MRFLGWIPLPRRENRVLPGRIRASTPSCDCSNSGGVVWSLEREGFELAKTGLEVRGQGELSPVKEEPLIAAIIARTQRSLVEMHRTVSIDDTDESVAISIDESATMALPNERLEALKARYVPTPNNQQQVGDGDLNKIMDRVLYEATKEGDVEKFVDALEEVSESRKLALSLIFDQVTPSGNSLLHVAASSGKDDVVELILIHFPYLVTRKNSSDDTPLHVAVQESARDEAYAVKIQGMSPVLAACKEWEWIPGILEEIIDGLPKLLHVRDENGGTPLHSAASAGNWMAVTVLLRACPYLALQTDKDGSYPIHIACEGGDCFTISALIYDTWPDLAEIKNNKGQNILHVAAKAGNNEAVQYILRECRELVKLKDVDGNTPLHLASMHNHCEVLRFLVSENRSDLELMNNDKLTALDVAMEPQSFSSKDPAVQGRKILIKAGVPRSKVLYIGSLLGYYSPLIGPRSKVYL
ncbi:hypothetical protein NL676_000878 [Syzygium grande]|nr:hypothetical protein NL676_000878 [Syzygium grande]